MLNNQAAELLRVQAAKAAAKQEAEGRPEFGALADRFLWMACAAEGLALLQSRRPHVGSCRALFEKKERGPCNCGRQRDIDLIDQLLLDLHEIMGNTCTHP